MKYEHRCAHAAAALLILASCSKKEGDDAGMSSDNSAQEDTFVQEQEEPQKSSIPGASIDPSPRESEDDMMARIMVEQERATAERQRKRKEDRRLAASKARDALVGKKLPDFSIKDKGEFSQVSVTEAGELELTIMHASGAAKIPYSDLPADLQKRLRYHKEDYAEALAARESADASAEVSSASASTETTKNVAESRELAPASGNSGASTPVDIEKSEMPDFNSELIKAQGELKQAALAVSDAKLKIRQMYSDYIRGVQSQSDRQRVQQMTSHINNLRLNEARWKADTDALRLATLIRSHQYARLKPVWEAFRQAQREAAAAKAHEISASDNIGWLQSLESSARVKSSAHQKAVERAEAALRQAERTRAQKETDARIRRQNFDEAFAAS